MKEALRAYWHTFTPRGQVCLLIAVVGLISDIGMSLAFGINMSWWHALAFVVFSCLMAVGFDEIALTWERGKRVAACVMTAMMVPIVAVAFVVHVGYTIGQQTIEKDASKVQNTKYEDTYKSIDENENSRKMAEESLAQLEKANGWSATVSATSLRAQLDTAQAAIDQEAARGGCKTKCLSRMKEKADIESRIAILEERTSLQQRIEAAKRWLEKARAAARTEQRKPSVVLAQTQWMSSIYNAALVRTGEDETLNPRENTMKFVGIFIGLAIAFANMMASPLGFLMAGRNRKDISANARTKVEEIAMSATAPSHAQPQDRTTVVHVNDAELRHVLRRALGTRVAA